MFTHYLKYCCSIVIILSFQATAQATVAYKWIDDDGQVNFSQRPPLDREVDIIKTGTGPKVTPEQSQEAVDKLIEQQTTNRKEKEEAEIAKQKESEREQAKTKNCDFARNNLQKYLDKPNSLAKKANGEYDPINEVDRQNRIKQLKQDVQKYCD